MRPTTPGDLPSDDLPRDEHLRAALRHAPDAALQPPPHLRAQIVAAAHRAAAEGPAPAASANPARPRRGWLPGPLGASGAFASLLLAGVIGLMWQGTPPGPAPDAPAAEAAMPSPPAAPPLAAAPTPAPAAAPPAAVVRQPIAAPAADAAAVKPRPATAAAPAPAAPPPAAKTTAPPAQALALPPPAPPAPPTPPAEAAVPTEARVQAAPAAAAARLGGPVRWRVDGVDQGVAVTAWVQAAEAELRRFGEPSGLSQLPGARSIELQAPNGAVARLWLSPTQLLWCPADGSGCRLATLTPASASALNEGLDAAVGPARGQPPKRDSR